MMSKRKLLEGKSSGRNRKKQDKKYDRIKNMRKHPHKGDWCKDSLQSLQNYLEKSPWQSLCNKNTSSIWNDWTCCKITISILQKLGGSALSLRKHFQLEERADFSAKVYCRSIIFRQVLCICFLVSTINFIET